MTLLELAERVEAAPATQEHLHFAQVYELLSKLDLITFDQATVFLRFMGANAYLDAALTLAPEGWPVFHLFNCHLGPDRWIWEADLAPQRSYADILRGQAATPALALCAAALRARSASLAQRSEGE